MKEDTKASLIFWTIIKEIKQFFLNNTSKILETNQFLLTKSDTGINLSKLRQERNYFVYPRYLSQLRYELLVT